MIRTDLIEFNVGLFDTDRKKSSLPDKFVDIMRKRTNNFILNFYESNDEAHFRHIFKFGNDTKKPFIGFHDIHSDNFLSLDFDKLKETTEKYDFLYSEDYSVVILSEHALEYLHDKYKAIEDHVPDKDQLTIKRFQDILYDLEEENFKIDTIDLGE